MLRASDSVSITDFQKKLNDLASTCFVARVVIAGHVDGYCRVCGIPFNSTVVKLLAAVNVLAFMVGICVELALSRHDASTGGRYGKAALSGAGFAAGVDAICMMGSGIWSHAKMWSRICEKDDSLARQINSELQDMLTRLPEADQARAGEAYHTLVVSINQKSPGRLTESQTLLTDEGAPAGPSTYNA